MWVSFESQGYWSCGEMSSDWRGRAVTPLISGAALLIVPFPGLRPKVAGVKFPSVPKSTGQHLGSPGGWRLLARVCKYLHSGLVSCIN